MIPVSFFLDVCERKCQWSRQDLSVNDNALASVLIRWVVPDSMIQTFYARVPKLLLQIEHNIYNKFLFWRGVHKPVISIQPIFSEQFCFFQHISLRESQSLFLVDNYSLSNWFLFICYWTCWLLQKDSIVYTCIYVRRMNWSLRDYNQFYYLYQCYVRVGDTSDRADMWCFLTKTEVKLVFSFVFVCLFFF